MCIGTLFLLGGVFILASIALRWDWIMTHYKVERVFRLLGNTRATLFYVMMGLGFAVIGLLLIVGIIRLE